MLLQHYYFPGNIAEQFSYTLASIIVVALAIVLYGCLSLCHSGCELPPDSSPLLHF